MANDDEEIEIGEAEAMIALNRPLKTIYADTPPVSGQVSYVLDRESEERAAAIRRLNELGALGMMENRARFDALRAARSKAELELASFADRNPWVLSPPAGVSRSSQALMTVFFAGLVLVATVVAAAKYQRNPPTLPPPSAGNTALPLLEADPPAPERQGRATRASAIGSITRVYGGQP